jgi:phosphinothricin acetyltransferase
MAEIYGQSLAARDSSMEAETSSAVFLAALDGQSPRECHLVVEVEGLPRGYGVVKSYSPRVGYRVACETSIYLDRANTGGGLGGLLQKALLERCRQYGYHHVVAKIWASNEGSLRFHQRFGFELVGVQKEIGFLAGEWRDVAILQLILSEVAPYCPGMA